MKNKTLQQKSLKNLILNYLLALLPLFLYGVYKNYFLAYNRNLISFSSIFKPLIILVITISIALIIEIVFIKIRKENINSNNIFAYPLVYAIILFLLLPYKFNLLIYFITLGIALIVIELLSNRKIPINLIAITSIIMLGLFKLNNCLTYANLYESTKNISYNLFDSFFGRTIGSFGTTNIFLILVGYILLLRNPLYKKEIPITCVVSFAAIGLLYAFVTKFTYLNLAEYLIETNFIFISVYLLPLSLFSPYTSEGSIVFAIISGILSFFLMIYIGPLEGAIIATICTSSLSKLIDIIILKIKEGKKINENRRF